MVDYFIYECQKCGRQYTGLDEPGASMPLREQGLGICVQCLEWIIHWREEAEKPPDRSGEAPKA